MSAGFFLTELTEFFQINRIGRQGNFLDRISVINRIGKVADAGPATVPFRVARTSLLSGCLTAKAMFLVEGRRLPLLPLCQWTFVCRLKCRRAIPGPRYS